MFEIFSIGESLFTLFASLAYAIQFLMKLQTNQFWILKGHSTINSASEYEPDVLNILCNEGLKTQNSAKNVWAHLRFCHPEILQLLKDDISLTITPKELKF